MVTGKKKKLSNSSKGIEQNFQHPRSQTRSSNTRAIKQSHLTALSGIDSFFLPMSATHHSHAYLRTTLPHVRKTAARAYRPAPLSKSQGLPKASLKGNKAKSLRHEEEIVLDEEDNMGSSFLQYWCVIARNTLIRPVSTDSNEQRHVRETDRRPQQFDPLLLRKVCPHEDP